MRLCDQIIPYSNDCGIFCNQIAKWCVVNLFEFASPFMSRNQLELMGLVLSDVSCGSNMILSCHLPYHFALRVTRPRSLTRPFFSVTYGLPCDCCLAFELDLDCVAGRFGYPNIAGFGVYSASYVPGSANSDVLMALITTIGYPSTTLRYYSSAAQWVPNINCTGQVTRGCDILVF
jgi:hypothetical protein